MPRLLVTGDGWSDRHFERLRAAGFDTIHHPEIALADLRALLPTLDAHVLGGSERLDAELLGQGARLRVVSFVGTGIGAFVDVEAAAALGIRLCNTPGVGTRAVAEHTVGLLLGLVRGLFGQNDAAKRGGVWSARTDELGATPVGIVGMGAIAEHVARTLTASFGCSVTYTNRTRKPELEEALGLRWVDAPTLFEEARAVVVLVATTPETTGLVDGRLLGRGDHGRFLVNTAGASIVDPTALLAALREGRVRAAAFDGYWIEPLPAPEADPYGLLTLPDGQFVVTPHLAAKTPQTWDRMLDLAVAGVIDAF